MSEFLSRRLVVGKAITGFCVALALPGCGGNPNEAEYLRTAPPGKPAEPESVASRRERTKNVPAAPAKGKKKAGSA
jgi:hypothetical protein